MRIIKQMATINRIGTHQGVTSLIKDLQAEEREERKVKSKPRLRGIVFAVKGFMSLVTSEAEANQPFKNGFTTI